MIQFVIFHITVFADNKCHLTEKKKKKILFPKDLLQLYNFKITDKLTYADDVTLLVYFPSLFQSVP